MLSPYRPGHRGWAGAGPEELRRAESARPLQGAARPGCGAAGPDLPFGPGPGPSESHRQLDLNGPDSDSEPRLSARLSRSLP